VWREAEAREDRSKDMWREVRGDEGEEVKRKKLWHASVSKVCNTIAFLRSKRESLTNRRK
jgi:hypothetical protein